MCVQGKDLFSTGSYSGSEHGRFNNVEVLDAGRLATYALTAETREQALC
jgi:hypothetical protein